MKMKFAFAAALAVATILISPAAKAESLRDALISAYKHSGLLEQNRAVLRAADEDVAQAIATLRPVLSYYANATFKNPVGSFSDHLQTNVGLSLKWLIYDGGASKTSVQIAKETVLSTRDKLVNVEQSVLLNAVTSYLNVLREREFVALRQNNVRLITQQLRAAKNRFDVGEVTRTDVSLAQSRLALSRANLAAAEGNLARSREAYRVAVGHYPKSLRNVPGIPATAKSQKAALAIAYKTHPAMLSAQHDVSAAELAISRAESGMKPTLNVVGRLNYDRHLNDSSSLGLEMTGPIYAGGKITSGYRQAMARRDATRAGLHVLRHDIAQAVGNAWSALQVSRVTLAASNRQISAARVAFNGIKEEATLGARTTLDVLDAEQELLDAKASRISAITDQHVAAYSLLSTMGLLTVDHLKLGIRTYDPSAYYNAIHRAPVDTTRSKRLDRVLRALGKQ